MTELEVAAVTVSRVLTLHLDFERVFFIDGYGGWATFFVDDDRATLSVASDWGAWSYTWGAGPWLGQATLSAALAHGFGTDAHYVANKLVRGNTDIFDPEATVKHWRAELLRQRREELIDRDQALEGWENLSRMTYCTTENEFMEAVGFHGLQWLFDVPWEHLERTDCPRYVVLCDTLLPAFVAALRELVAPPPPAPREAVQ